MYQDRSIKTYFPVSDQAANASSRQTGGQKRDSPGQCPASPTKQPKRKSQEVAVDPVTVDILPPTASFDSTTSRRLSDIFDAPMGMAEPSTAETTLLEDDEKEESQDYFPIEQAREFLQDPSLSRSLDLLGSHTSSPAPSFLGKARSTFDPVKSNLPSNLSFEAVYEIQSLALSWGIKSSAVFKALEPLCGSKINDSSARWNAIKSISKDRQPHNLTDSSSWAPKKEEWQSVYLSATLDWAAPSAGELFRLQLNGPVIDRTCRFHRYLGGTRYLTLNVPPLDKKSIPWELRGIGINKFSTQPETRDITLKDFLDWHLCWNQNLGSSDLKLFARLKLGLSKTIPTVVLNQDEFVEVDDRYGSDGQTVMNDGCAMMSFELGNEIRKMLGLAEIPAVFQGRISGAKGVWIVDRWHSMPDTGRRFSIQVNPSQLKVKPHPRHREACDLQRTFEVSAWSHSTGAAAINSQFITVLNDRGVPSVVLKTRLEDSFKTYYDELLQAQEDPRLIRAWLQTFHHVVRDNEIKVIGALPENKVERMHMLLDAGFQPAECTFLHDLIRQTMCWYSSSYIEKMKIPVPQSAYVYCVPDLCGVLEEGEIHLGFTVPWNDPVKGISGSFVTGCDGLVGRNPANLPSDIQRVRFRFEPRLSDCRDVVFFSTKGKVPLASLLSGGDYDGDGVWVCWDQDMVTQFQNYGPGPPNDITPQECGLINRSRPLDSIFPQGTVGTAEIHNFMEGCLRFNMAYSYLGKCTNTHQMLVYRDSLKRGGRAALQSKEAIRLAALASFLVDASKQGYELSSESWIAIKHETCGKAPLEPPPFKKTGREGDSCAFNTANIVDYLRFGVAQKEKDRILTDWANRKPQPSQDRSLIQPFDRLWKLTECQRPHGTGTGADSVLREILVALKSEIRDIVEDWRRGSQRSDNFESTSYRRRLAAAAEAFAAIQPLQARDDDPTASAAQHYFYQMVALVDGFWDQVKASCFYAQYFIFNEQLVFNVAGNRLCQIKASSLGDTRTMTTSMYSVLKVDSKSLKRQLGSGVDDDDNDLGMSNTTFASEATRGSQYF
ncbi:hypothetical protein DV738_g3248, partial [Chaetothyriales sp. CBS 135597]